MHTRHRPRSLHGSVLIAGLRIDKSVLGVAESRHRCLRLWCPATIVFETAEALVVIFPGHKRVISDEVLGAPLVRANSSFCTFQLDAEEAALIDAPANSLLRLANEQVVIERLVESVAPGEWIDLGVIEHVTTRPLTQCPPVPDLAPPQAKTVREVLGNEVPEVAPAQAKLMRRLAGQPEGLSGHWLQRTISEVGRAMRWLFPRASRPASPGYASASTTPPRPTLMVWLGHIFNRVIYGFGLQRILGNRSARYLFRVASLFEANDVEEALRLAIPLSAVKQVKAGRVFSAFWRPARRADFSISRAGSQGGASLPVDPEFYDYMRSLYRRSFDQLKAQGRREMAAFVMAELLAQSEEAVAYLESEGEFVRAAELAEARSCSPSLVVRAWFLAGNVSRATEVARERGAFADAVRRLEKSHPEQAKMLRLLWAESLALAGDHATAIQVATALKDAKALIDKWLELGITQGEQAPLLTAIEASIYPERWPQIQVRVKAWTAATDPLAHERHRQFADALINAVPSVTVSWLSRFWLRHLACVGDNIDETTAKGLVKASRDQILKADLLNHGVQRAVQPRTEAPHFDMKGRGGSAVKDVIPLPSGRVLLGLGEGGVLLVGTRGNIVHHFDVPADHLVASDKGDRVLALAKRGESYLCSRIMVAERMTHPGAFMHLDNWLPTFDGNIWFVVQGHRLLALDVFVPARPPRCFWSVDFDNESNVATLSRNAGSLFLLVRGWDLETWRYALPELVLRGRRPVELFARLSNPDVEAPDGISMMPFIGAAISEQGEPLVCRFDPSSHEYVLELRNVSRRFDATDASTNVVVQHGGGNIFAFAVSHADRVVLRVLDSTLQVLATVSVPGAQQVCLRFTKRHLVIASDLGAVGVLDMERQSMRDVGIAWYR